MINALKLKSRNCIEWSVDPPFSRHFRIISKNFRLQGVKTNFIYVKSGSFFLFCESATPLKTVVDIRVYLTSGYNQSLFRITRFSGRKAEIWSSCYPNLLSVTFEIVILSDIFISKFFFS